MAATHTTTERTTSIDKKTFFIIFIFKVDFYREGLVSVVFCFRVRRREAMSIKVNRNDTGKQKHTRIDRVERMKNKIFSKNSGRNSRSISQTPKKVARIPITARAANETIPVLVTI